jgi:hypothetical protein
MVESQQQQMSKSKRKKTAERSEDKKRRGEVRLSEQSPTQSTATTMPYIPTIADMVYNSQNYTETGLIESDILNIDFQRLRNEAKNKMWQQIDVRMRIMTELEMLLQNIREIILSYDEGFPSVLVDFRGQAFQVNLNNNNINYFRNRETEIVNILEVFNQSIKEQIENWIFRRPSSAGPTSRIPELPTVEDFIRDIQMQTNRPFFIPSPKNYKTVIEFHRKKGNYLKVREWEQLFTPEGRQRLIDRLYELLERLNQIINDCNAKCEVRVADIIVDENIVRLMNIRRQEIQYFINSWNESLGIISTSLKLPTVEELEESFQNNKIVSIPSPEMVSSQIKILKIQKKDREAKEWEKLTNFEGVYEMIGNLEALAEGIRDAVNKYKNSREYRSVATRLTVKLNEILEIIFRWEQRLFHLTLPPSPRGDEKGSPKTPSSIPLVATVEDIIEAQLE